MSRVCDGVCTSNLVISEKCDDDESTLDIVMSEVHGGGGLRYVAI